MIRTLTVADNAHYVGLIDAGSWLRLSANPALMADTLTQTERFVTEFGPERAPALLCQWLGERFIVAYRPDQVHDRGLYADPGGDDPGGGPPC